MQITDLIRDSPLRDLGTVLSQCAHIIVPRYEEDDSFGYDPEEEVPIGGRDDDDNDQTDEDYEPERDDRSGGSGESDREGAGVKRVRGCFVWLWIGRVIKKGRVKFKRKGRVTFRKGRVQGWLRECVERVRE